MNPNDDDDDDSGNDLYEMDLNLFVPTPPTTEDSMREHFPRFDSTSRNEDNDTRYGDNCSRGSFTSSFSKNISKPLSKSFKVIIFLNFLFKQNTLLLCAIFVFA